MGIVGTRGSDFLGERGGGGYHYIHTFEMGL